MFIIGIIIVIAICVWIYVAIRKRGKKCKFCGEKYDVSCIQDIKVLRTVPSAMGADYSDVGVVMKCKKCGKIANVNITLRSYQSKAYLDEEVKKHFK